MGFAVAAKPAEKKSKAVAPEPAPAEGPQFEHATGMPAGLPLFLSGFLQRKLAIGSVDHPLEKEADRVADAVMSPRFTLGRIEPSFENPGIRRKCACGGSTAGECEECQKKRQDELVTPPAVQRRAKGPDAGGADAPPIVHEALRSGGGPLEPHTRTLMESRFGQDFRDVRIHSSALAAKSTKAIDALAYTAGKDVVFAEGQYSPATQAGQRLLAHELAHVVQQSGTGSGPTPDGKGAVGPPVSDRIQRFGGPEHEQLGNVTGATIDLGGGLTLTWGEVVALAGDEYGSAEELRDEAAHNIPRLRGRLKHDMVLGPLPALPKGESDEATHSSARYVELAMYNVSHFAAGGTAVETWRSHHERALVSAIISGIEADAAEWQSAQLTEAFGQHFLTDSFSAGHVRTPRAAILAWYENDFAPRAMGPLLAWMRRRVVDTVTADVSGQMLAPTSVIKAALDAALGAVFLVLDGILRERFTTLLGAGIAGPVSGVLHDRDNERGIWVNSDAHPDAWLAYGDGRLTCGPVSRDQAELAVITAREQLVEAQSLGRTRRAHAGKAPPTHGRTSPGGVPGTVHFAFDSSALTPATTAALQLVADYLFAHPEQVVDAIGFTCPLGAAGYNYGLGMRRAEAVAGWLMSHGVDPMRISSSSGGATHLVETAIRRYAANRRVELRFRATGAEPPDLVWAQQTLAAKFPPPYTAVERYIPREVPGLNDPQEDWHWGNMSSVMAAEVDHWIAGYVGGAEPAILADPSLVDRSLPVPDLPPRGTHNVTLHPRAAVKAVLDEIIADPTGQLGRILGEPAANRTTPPLPPALPCAPAP